jgi:glyoxylase-like metal-dependent hydrolase (beta-lactamase superfamily II)
MRRLIYGLLVFAVLAGGYYWMVLDSRMPADASYPLDMAEVRKLADAMPGAKPAQLRYEHIYNSRFTKGMTVAGDGWSGTDLAIYSYQVVYPGRTVIIDSAMSQDVPLPGFAVQNYDTAAWNRMLVAMDKASLIVITHEHMDHIGGIAAHPNLEAILPNIRLTDAQLAHPDRMWPLKLPEEMFAGYQPLKYERYHAIAPGMVLIKSPGHTPGSQMVYVKLADGREVLFLGDVVWKMRNIETQRERPRWVTALLVREDRHAVFGQIKALGELMQREPGMKIVPGHDGPVVDALAADGYLQPGFQP